MMKCQQCGFENPDAATVCGACRSIFPPSPDKAPVSPKPVQSLLERHAGAEAGSIPAEVLQLYREDRCMDAHDRLQSLRARDPRFSPALAKLLDEPRLWLEPSPPPTMFTFNGLGSRLYGRRFPASDDTYVATLYIVFFYIPLIPMGSYLVKDATGGWGRSWHFLGTVPTPREARLVPLYWIGGIVALFLFLAFLSKLPD